MAHWFTRSHPPDLDYYYVVSSRVSNPCGMKDLRELPSSVGAGIDQRACVMPTRLLAGDDCSNPFVVFRAYRPVTSRDEGRPQRRARSGLVIRTQSPLFSHGRSWRLHSAPSLDSDDSQRTAFSTCRAAVSISELAVTVAFWLADRYPPLVSEVERLLDPGFDQSKDEFSKYCLVQMGPFFSATPRKCKAGNPKMTDAVSRVSELQVGRGFL